MMARFYRLAALYIVYYGISFNFHRFFSLPQNENGCPSFGTIVYFKSTLFPSHGTHFQITATFIQMLEINSQNFKWLSIKTMHFTLTHGHSFKRLAIIEHSKIGWLLFIFNLPPQTRGLIIFSTLNGTWKRDDFHFSLS